MKWIYNIWFVLFIVNAILIIFKLFKIKEKIISLSIWPKILALHFSIIVTILFLGTLSSGELKSDNVLYGSVILFFSLYAMYCAFMFRYQFTDTHFRWFNGLYIRSITLTGISKYIFYLRKNTIRKIGIIYDGNEIKLNNYLSLENMISNNSKKCKIPIMKRSD